MLTETKNSKGCNLLESYFLDFRYNLFNTGTHAKYYVSFPKSITNDLGVSKLPIKKMSHYIPQDNQYYARLLEVNISRGVRKMHVGVYVPSRDKSEEKIRRKKYFWTSYLAELKRFNSFLALSVVISILLIETIFQNTTFTWIGNMIFMNIYYNWDIIDAFKMCHPSQHEIVG